MEKTTQISRLNGKPSGIPKHTNFIFLLALFLTLRVIFFLFLPSGHPILASDLTTQNILLAVNQQRQLRNLSLLNTNTLLMEAAQYKSNDMQARHYFSHIDPDGHYIWDEIVALGYTPYLELGENLAINFYDTDSLMSAWMNSPEHRANILLPGFEDQGMGLSLGTVSQGQYYSAITNTFGTLAPAPNPAKKPAAPSPSPSPSKRSSPAPADQVQASPKAAASPTSLVSAATQSQNPAAQPETVAPRAGTQPIENPQANFTVSEQGSFPRATTSETASLARQKVKPATTLVGSALTNSLNAYEINRYLILAFGMVLLLLIVLDLRNSAIKKTGSLDKKISNLIMLLMSLIVIAFMYWL
jgi:hypothetical protein